MAPGPELNDTTLRLTAPDTQLRILAEAIPQMVYTSDAQGNLQYANKRWYEYTGLTYDQTRNLHWLRSVHPDDAETTRLEWQKAVETGNVYEISHRLRRSDDVYRWHLTRALPLKNASGEITSWFGTSTDIEDQRQASERVKVLLESSVQERTEALEIARDEAVRASTLKSQFVQNISHEIRTPMSGILGMSELLADMELSPEAKEMSNHILIAASTLMGIVNDLLDFSKLDANKVTLQKNKFSLGELLESAVLSVSSVVSKKNL
ncbi:MAG: PAS domain-containing protein, partial [Candidatus Melainabacteria bacterium]|nr:PAS domain-containing protein [Candidatus Melainabacteria bacterium]